MKDNTPERPNFGPIPPNLLLIGLNPLASFFIAPMFGDQSLVFITLFIGNQQTLAHVGLRNSNLDATLAQFKIMDSETEFIFPTFKDT